MEGSSCTIDSDCGCFGLYLCVQSVCTSVYLDEGKQLTITWPTAHWSSLFCVWHGPTAPMNSQTRPRGYKTFLMLNSIVQERNYISILASVLILLFVDYNVYLCCHIYSRNNICLNQLSMIFVLHINVKMPAIVGILTFMSRKNNILGLSESEKS